MNRFKDINYLFLKFQNNHNNFIGFQILFTLSQQNLNPTLNVISKYRVNVFFFLFFSYEN